MSPTMLISSSHSSLCIFYFFFFFFNDTATTEIYTLSLHDALPIYRFMLKLRIGYPNREEERQIHELMARTRSEEHTSELQSQSNLVCRLLLEKKKKINDHQRVFPRAE